VLAFEDLHWADPSLLDLVEMLGARLRDAPILLLVLSRPELLDARPSWGGGQPSYTALQLEALDDAHARALAAQVLTRLPPGDLEERAAQFAATAEGNPLFIEQLAAAVIEADRPSDALPTTIRGIVAARLDGLPAGERAVLVDAAVQGKVFWEGGLRRTHDDSQRLAQVLDALERRYLIRRERVSAIEGDHQYAFKHMLIRDVAYELLPRARRRELHEQCALFLEDVTSEIGEAGAALARHWRDAGHPSKALEYLVAAAEQEERGWAKDHAAELYREALALVPEEETERRSELRRRLAIAHQAHYHVEDARLLGLGEPES
jgi:predicted ATPase